MEPTPSTPDWESAFQAWIDVSLADLEAQFTASPQGLDNNAQRLLALARDNLNQLLELIRSAVQRGDDCIDWSGKAGTLNRMTPAARGGLAYLEGHGMLPLPVNWPLEWERLRDQDMNDPTGWRTPPTQPSTPRSPDDPSPSAGT